MAIANGADNSKFQIKKNFTESNGRTTPLFFTPYVVYNKNADKSVNATTYLLYVKPKSLVRSENPSDAKNTGGAVGVDAFYITAGVSENGKFKAIPYSEAKYLKSDGTLATYTPTSDDLKRGKYPVSNQVRAEMASSQAGSLNALGKDTATDLLITTDPGIPRKDAKDAMRRGTAPPAEAPAAPGSDQGGGSGGGGGPAPAAPPGQESPTPDAIKVSELNVANENEAFFSKLDVGTLEYPLSAAKSGQDLLKIEILRYNGAELVPNDFSTKRRAFGNKDAKGAEQSSGTIYLGLQASISDQNTINWGPDTMTALDMSLQAGFLNLVDNGGQALPGVVKAFETRFGGDNTQASFGVLKAYLAKQAANTGSGGGNLFTRLTGAIVNPNMELLFNGPQLRSFTFTFNMTPRGAVEAESVKKIINALKKTSAVQLGIGELFLKTPFIYRLTYLTEGLKPHPSLNRIKECALMNISVDYTPANVYMTYNDTDKTMTSYSMQLQFSELDPIYGDDYKAQGSDTTSADVGKIGY